MTTSHVTGLRCTVCGKEYKTGEVEYTCTEGEGMHKPLGIVGNLDVQYDLKAAAAELPAAGRAMPLWSFGMWRYLPLLPVSLPGAANPGETANILRGLCSVGNTPLIRCSDKLTAEIGAAEVWVKDEGRNPSASFKDRASSLVALKAAVEGRPVVSTASTGNAAAALAYASACLQRPCIIFVPASAPEAKRAQLLVYGAQVVLVEGCYDDAFDLCGLACEKYGWYCRSTGVNPFTVEGKKTVSFELCEQLKARRSNKDLNMEFEAPDVIVVSVGDGNIISGVHKGLKELLAMGLIKKMPAIIGVQAEGSASIAKAWERKADLHKEALPVIDATTIADSIEAGLPRDPLRALEAASMTPGGAYVTVSDTEILAAIPDLARSTGVFGEPAAATALAGMRKAAAKGLIPQGSVVVMLSTGNGLKDINSAKKSVQTAIDSVLRVKPGDLDALSVLVPKK